VACAEHVRVVRPRGWADGVEEEEREDAVLRHHLVAARELREQQPRLVILEQARGLLVEDQLGRPHEHEHDGEGHLVDQRRVKSARLEAAHHVVEIHQRLRRDVLLERLAFRARGRRKDRRRPRACRGDARHWTHRHLEEDGARSRLDVLHEKLDPLVSAQNALGCSFCSLVRVVCAASHEVGQRPCTFFAPKTRQQESR
jgi:hypothetical protein